MSIDPMALVQESRPKASSAASSFTPTPGAMRQRRDTMIDTPSGARSAAELSARPGTANFRAGVGNPPCAECNQDHNPIKERLGEYDHNYVHPDSVDTGGLVVLQGMPPPVPEAVAVPAPVAAAAPAKRISIFPGRGDDDYILVVERREADDWEDDYKKKLTGDSLAVLLPVLRALDVKIKDRTGGDLVELTQRAG